MKSLRYNASLVGVAVALALSAPINAQVLEEITVTARKVEENLQDIPLSISAFSNEQMRAAGIDSIDEIATFTPGLVISNYTGVRDEPNLRFRGMDNSSRNRRNALASAFVDGVYITGSSQWVSTNDLQRVEVVKGPQSAFFGRATFGGAVEFVTKDPGDTLGGDLRLSIGEYGRRDVEASFEAPLIADKLAFRVSGRSFSYDGGYPNRPANGGSGDRLGAQTTDAISLTLLATPTDNLSIRFRTTYSQDEDGPGVAFITPSTNNNCGPFFDPATTPGITPRTYYCGDVNDIDQPLGYDTGVTLGQPGTSWPRPEFGLDRYISLTSLKIDYDINDYTLTSVTGAYRENIESMREFTPGTLISYGQNRDETFSQEFRLTSPQDRALKWMVGAYYLDLTYGGSNAGFGCSSPDTYINCSTAPFFGPFTRGDFFFGAPVRGAFGGIFGFGSMPDPDDFVENTAIFGSISYDITDQLGVSLELRRAEEEIERGSVTQAVTGDTIILKDTFDSTVPRVIVEYKPTDETLIYANYAEGNQPGSFNAEIAAFAPQQIPVFEAQFGAGVAVPEAELKNYEIGVKTTLFDGRLAVNAAAYMMDWGQTFQTFFVGFDSDGDGDFDAQDNQQVDFSANGESEIIGFEFAGNLAITDALALGLSYNFNDTELKRYDDNNYAQVFGQFSAAGNELPRSPKHSAVLTLDWSAPRSGGGEWFGRLDTQYQSESFAWVHNLASTGSFIRANLRGGWRNDQYSWTVWLNNVTDDDTIPAIRRFSDLANGGFGFAGTLPRPREFGVTFSMGFGGGQ